MTRKKGPSGPGPGPGSGAEQRQSPNAAMLPGYLDPEGAHGEIWVALVKPEEEGKTLPTNPFTIAKSIHSTVGTVHSVHRNRDGNLVVKVRGEAKLKKLLRMKQLIGDDTKVTVEEHPTLNRTKVVVTCRSVEGIPDAELMNEPTMKAQGVVDIRRFKKEGKDTNTMTVTVRGTVAPDAIYFGFERCEAKLFVPAPMQCFRCFYYGHTKAHCKAEKEACRNCSGDHKIVKDAEGKTVCTAPARCLHCNKGHSPTSRLCEQYKEEEEVLRIRNTMGKSPREARRYYEEKKQQEARSYARIAGANSQSVQDRIVAAQNNSDIAALRKELEEAKKVNQEAKKANEEIASLRKDLAKSKKDLKAALRQVKALKEAMEEDESSEEIESEDADDKDDDEDDEVEMMDVGNNEIPSNDEQNTEKENTATKGSATKTSGERPSATKNTATETSTEKSSATKETGKKGKGLPKRKIVDSSGSHVESADEGKGNDKTKKTTKSNQPTTKKPKGQGRPNSNSDDNKERKEQ